MLYYIEIIIYINILYIIYYKSSRFADYNIKKPHLFRQNSKSIKIRKLLMIKSQRKKIYMIYYTTYVRLKPAFIELSLPL